jgi:long-chain acyl-CoA synthetase
MEKIWLQSYPPFVPETIDPDQYPHLPAALDDFCNTYSEHHAFSNYGTALTYRQLAQYSMSLAAYFQQELKLQPHDRVAIMMPNILQYPVVLFAVLRAGLTVVNVNPLYMPRELKHELMDSGAKAIVVLANFAHVVEAVLSEVPVRHVLVTHMGDLFPAVKGFAFNVAVKYILRMVPHWRIPNAHDFKSALKKSRELKFSPPIIKAEDIAFLQYTGGTTGIPKGAMLSHRNLLANIFQCRAWIRGKLELGEEKLLAALPLYHIFSLTVSCFTFLALGGECVLITNPRDIRELVRCWHKRAPTCFIGLNTLFVHLMKNAQFQRLNFKNLKLSVSGGMPTQPSVAQEWQNMTGCVVTEGYGLTEASPVVTINPLNMTYFNQSVGLPIPATEVKICDNAGNQLNVDEIGELMVKGPQVMPGYWQNPAETTHVLSADGWLKTGDMARIDAQGFIFLVDRKKDLIIVSGFNVYPREVETVILAHPGVDDVVVVGKSSGATGELVKAVIVKKDPQLTEQTILDYCRLQLTPYKVPKIIEFRDHLPKSSLGKVLRWQL